MTRLIEILISLAIVLGLYLVVALVLPSKRHLVEKVETNRKLTIVFDSLNSLRRFKEDVRQVAQGFECGIGLESFSDIHQGDLIEAYEVREIPRG